MLRRSLFVGAVFLGVAILVAAGALFAFLPLCSESVIQEAVSPDGRYRAQVSEGGCGVTTGVTTYITVERSFNTLLAKEADVLIAEGDRVSLDARIRWTGPRRLVISWNGSEQVFLYESKALGVSVDYADR